MRTSTRFPSAPRQPLNWRASFNRLRASASTGRRLASLFAVIALGAVSSSQMSAATLTWDADGTPTNGSTDGSGTWNTTNVNWYNGTTDVVWPNTTGDTAVFGSGMLGNYTVTVGTVNAGAITFNQGGYTLTGGTITAPNTGFTITTNGGTDTIASTITGASNTQLTKTGSGTLVLSALTATAGSPLLTVTGGTFVPSSGIFDSVVQLVNGSALGGAPAAITTEFVLNAGTLKFTQSGGNIVGTNRTTQVNAAGGALFDAGAGTATTPDQFNGLITFNAGTAGTNLYLSNLTGGNTQFTSTGVISGTGNVVWNGLGTAQFQAADTYTGSTTVNSGTLSLQGSLASTSLVLGGGTLAYAPATASSTMNFSSGTTLNVGNSAVSVTAGNTLALGAITHNAGGLISFGTTGTTTTTTAANGILGPYAFTGTGTSMSYVTGGGTVAAYTGGTAAATATGVTDTSGTVNYDVAAGGAVGTGASINTLHYIGAVDTISGPLTLNGLMNAGTGTLTLSGAVTIGSNRELVVLGNGQATTFSSAIGNNGAGASSLTYGGTGTLTLGAFNTYTGGTVVDGGTLALNRGGGTATVLGAITVNPGATLGLITADALGYSSAATSVTVVNVNGGTVSNSGGNEGSFTSFNLTGGTVSSTAAQTYIINTTANGITSNASGTTSTFSAPIQGQNGGTNLVVTTASGTTASGVDLLISGAISANQTAIGLTKMGAGYLNLTGQSTFAGNVLISAGDLNIGASAVNNGATGALGLSNAGKTITVSSGATLSGTTTNWFGNQANTGTLPAITVNGGNLITSRYTTIGAVNLNGASMYDNDTADTGTYQSFALRGNVTVGGTAASSISTTTASATAGGVHLGANTLFTVADATGNANVDLTVSAPLRNQSGDFGSAAGGFTKAGAGTMLLSGFSTFTGGVIVNAGTLALGTSAAAGTVQGVVTVNTGGTLNLATNDALGYNADGTQVATLNVNGGTVTSVAGTNEGYNTTFNLTGGTVSAGALFRFNVDAATPATLNSLASSTTSVFSGTIDDFPGAGTAGTLGINVATGTVASGGPDLTISGVILNSGGTAGLAGITKGGSGLLNLTGQNTFSGPVIVSNGTLNIGVSGVNAGGSSALGLANTGKTVTVASGATLSGTVNNWFGNNLNTGTLPAITLNGGALTTTRYTTIGALNLNGATVTASSIDASNFQAFALRGNVTVGGTAASTITSTNVTTTTGGYHLGANTTFTVADATGDANTDLTVSAPLINQSGDFGNAAGALTKAGPGTMALTATNTYTGTTTVNAGTLLISGSINSSPTVSVTASGGALTLSNTAATVLGDTATLSLVTGTTFNLNAAAGTSEVIGSLVLDGTAEPNGTYTAAQLMAFDTSITFSSLSGETLTIGAVPEPATWLAGCLLVGLTGMSQRRRINGLLKLARG